MLGGASVGHDDVDAGGHVDVGAGRVAEDAHAGGGIYAHGGRACNGDMAGSGAYYSRGGGVGRHVVIARHDKARGGDEVEYLPAEVHRYVVDIWFGSECAQHIVAFGSLRQVVGGGDRR